jgi:hypothetical protein
MRRGQGQTSRKEYEPTNTIQQLQSLCSCFEHCAPVSHLHGLHFAEAVRRTANAATARTDGRMMDTAGYFACNGASS